MARGRALEDWLPWVEETDPRRNAVVTRSGGILRVARVVPPDLESAGPHDLVRYNLRLAAAVSRLGDGWSVWWDQHRIPAPGYLPESDFGGCLAARLVHESQRRQFTEAGRPVFANEVFVALHYVPPKVDVRRFLWERNRKAASGILDDFEADTATFLEEIGATTRAVEVLGGEELLSYLYATVSSATSGCSGWTTRGCSRCCARRTGTTARSSASAAGTSRRWRFWSPGSPDPLTCDELYSLPYPCRWTATFHCMSAASQPAEVEKVRKAHSMNALRWGTLLERAVTRNRYAGRENPEAVEAMEELDELRKRLRKNPIVRASFNVHLPADTREEADRRAAYVQARLRARGLTCEPATLNSFRALMGDMPGAATREVINPRRWGVPTLAATRVSPVTGVSEGARWDWLLEGPALLQAATPRGVPYFFSLHAPGSDVGHTAIIGRVGGGKSTLLSTAALSFRRYRGARVIFVDRKASFMPACLCAGGSWNEIGPGGEGLQPLRHVDRAEDLGWAQEWLQEALEAQGLARNNHTADALTRALRLVATEAPDDRTLTALWTYLEGDAGARDALRPYLDGAGGPYGALFDGVVPGYGGAEGDEGYVVAFETDGLGGLGRRVAELALAALFRAIERDHLRGPAPKLLVFDEAWAWLEPGSPLERRMVTAVREYRKLKTSVVLATQEVSDVAEGTARALWHQCENKIFLPDATANDPVVKLDYLRAGLTEAQVESLAGGRSKGDYVFRDNTGITRLASVRLEDEALRICGASSQRDLMLARRLLAEGVRPGEEFLRRWLAEAGLPASPVPLAAE